MIKVLQLLSHSGDGIKNEDKIWHGPQDVLVLDGSTSLSPSSLDATWFVDRFSRLYAEAITATGDICHAINRTLEVLFDEFKEAVKDDATVAPKFFPSASGLFFHTDGANLQIVTIGDCCANIYFKDQALPLCVYDPEVSVYDQRVFSAMETMRQSTGKSISELVQAPEIRSMLALHRSNMNTPSGYRILSFGMTPCLPDSVITLPTENIHHIVAFTDGFDLVDHLLEDMDYPLSQACDELRRAEEQDNLLNENVRFKVHDDASAIVFEV